MRKYISVAIILVLFVTFLTPIAVASEDSSDFQMYGTSFWVAMIIGAGVLIYLGSMIFQYAQRALRTAKEVQNLHPSWSEETCKDVAEGKIAIGMTKKQVKASWGSPSNINTTVTNYSSTEQWVYGEYPSVTYLYFEGDRLSSWQD